MTATAGLAYVRYVIGPPQMRNLTLASAGSHNQQVADTPLDLSSNTLVTTGGR